MLETVNSAPSPTLCSLPRADDAAKALESAREKQRFFGKKISVEQHDGVAEEEADYRPPEAELDEYHHKATRTLFVGNLDNDISKEKLKDVFKVYGPILVRIHVLFLIIF